MLAKNRNRLSNFIYKYILPSDLRLLVAMCMVNNVITEKEYREQPRKVLEKLMEHLKNYIPSTYTTFKEAGDMYRKREKK